MFDMNDFVKLMKKTAVEAVNASKPANMIFGKVISTSPLQIKVDQKLILGKSQLVLSKNVTDYRLSVTVDWDTDDASTDADIEVSHVHKTSGSRTLTVHNALKTGEEVILMQVAGGQKYIVIDKIGKG